LTERLWNREIQRRAPQKKVVVIEMKHISHTISQEEQEGILELINGEIKLRCRGVFTKHVVIQLTRAQPGT